METSFFIQIISIVIIFSILLFITPVFTVVTGPFQTTNGVVIGQVIKNIFKGIPFAKPPI